MENKENNTIKQELINKAEEAFCFVCEEVMSCPTYCNKYRKFSEYLRDGLNPFD